MKAEWVPTYAALAGAAGGGAAALAFPSHEPDRPVLGGTLRVRGRAGYRSATRAPRVRTVRNSQGSPVVVGTKAAKVELRIFVKRDADPRYRLEAPLLTLCVESDGGAVVVSDRFSTVYGVGSGTSEALSDYLQSLFDYFAKLEAREESLAGGLRRELTELRRYIVSNQ